MIHDRIRSALLVSLLTSLVLLGAMPGHADTDEDGPPAKGELAVVPWSGSTLEVPLPGDRTLEVLFQEDFDDHSTGWSLEGAWTTGSLLPFGLRGSGATTSASPPYAGDSSARLVSPPIALPPLTRHGDRLQLRFAEWYEIESHYDRGRVQVSVDDGETWSTLGDRDGRCDGNAALLGLNAFAGYELRIGFLFESDGTDEFSGWILDKVRVELLRYRELVVEIPTLNHQNFEDIYMDVTVRADGVGVSDVPAENFAVFENDELQEDQFTVVPPDEGGGIRSVDVVFLMDNSQSMEYEIAAVSANVAGFVEDLAASGANSALGLCRFGQTSGGGQPVLVDNGNLTTDLDYFIDDIWNLNTANGGYEPGYFAICESSAGFSFRPGARRVFIIITDESPDQGGCNLAAALDACESNDITLFALTNGTYAGHFTSLAATTGGAVLDIYSPMEEVLTFIEEIVSDTYRISYKSSIGSDVWHNVTVEVAYEEEYGYAYAQYMPGSAPQISLTPETDALSDEPVGQGADHLRIEARITDALTPFVESATLFYRVTGSAGYQSRELAYQGEDIYAALLPSSTVQEPGVDYYITATDGSTSSSFPRLDPVNNPLQIAVLPNLAPVIEHQPPTIESYIVGNMIDIHAEVIDNTNNVESVELHYRQGGQLNYTTLVMSVVYNDIWWARIPGEEVTASGIEYYIHAEDDLGVGNYSASAQEPHQLLPWDQTLFAQLTFLVVEPNLTSRVARVRLRAKAVPNPLARSDRDYWDVLYTEEAFVTVEVKDHFATFTQAHLEGLFDPDDILHWKTEELELLSGQDDILGHILFEFHQEDADGSEGDAGRKLVDAIVFLHSDLDEIDGDNPKYEAAFEAGWVYYDPDDSEYQVSMLIPPRGRIEDIRGADGADAGAKPLLFVHGINGHYPYWQEPGDNRRSITDEYYEFNNMKYDTWEFYYPNNQFIDDIATLLDRAVENLLQPGGVFNTGHYPDGKLTLVGDSMGSLVSRKYIQGAGDGDNPHPRVSRLFMYVPPNHGSHASFRMTHGQSDIFDDLGPYLGKDPAAPAHIHMCPGSLFLENLNSSTPRSLESGDIGRDYLVCAGSDNIALLSAIHSEVDDQDDGVVAISSASLLDHGVPLTVAHENHTSLRKTEAGVAMLKKFLSPSYQFSTLWIPSEVDYARGSWIEDPIVARGDWDEVEPNLGINTIHLPHLIDPSSHMGVDLLDWFDSAPFLRIVINGDGIGDNKFRLNANACESGVPSSCGGRLISYNTHRHKDLALHFVPEGEYRLLFSQLLPDPENEDNSYHHYLGFAVTELDVKHLVTTHQTITLSEHLAMRLNTPNSQSLPPLEAREELEEGFIDYGFTVDSRMDTLVFSLSGEAGDPVFAQHGFRIRRPGGGWIYQDDVAGEPDIAFEDDVDHGFASFFVVEPESGGWQLGRSSGLSVARVAALYQSDLNVRLENVESEGSEDSALLEARISGAGACVSENLNVEAGLMSAGGSLSHTEMISFQEVPGSPDRMQARFTPERRGTYLLNLEYRCEQSDGEVLVRRLTQTLTIGSDDLVPERETGLFYPSPFDPGEGDGIFRLSLTQDRHVELKIYDSGDHLVRTLVDDFLHAQVHEISWDGRNGAGGVVANGVYFIVLDTGGGDVKVTKIAVLK